MARFVARVAVVSTCAFALIPRNGFAQDESNGDGAATRGRIENAENVESSARVRALALFEQSAVRYDHRDFQGAIELLKEAYALYPEPVLLYNLARAYEGLHDKAEAAGAYERYVAAEPTAPDHALLRQRAAFLRAQLANEERARAETSRVAPPSSIGTAPLVLGGIGIAGLGVAAALDLVAQNRHRDAVRQTDAATAQREQRQAEDLVLGANISLVGGAVLTVTGAAWGIVLLATRSKPEQRGRVELRLAPASASICGHF